MLIEQTLEKMNVMKLSGMAEGLRQQLGSAEHVKLAFDDRLGLLVDAEWIAPDRALHLAASGERKVIFPTRMNLQLLAESADPADAVARARARQLVTVEPWVDGRVLRIPENAGYGPVTEPLEAL